MNAFYAALLFYLFVVLAVCASALTWGGRDERAVATGYIVAAAATWIVAMTQRVHYREPQYAVMAVDIVFLVFLLLIVRRSRRFWPLWVAAAHLVGIFTHIVRILQPSTLAEAYASVQPFWAFPMLFALAVGTFHNRTVRS